MRNFSAARLSLCRKGLRGGAERRNGEDSGGEVEEGTGKDGKSG